MFVVLSRPAKHGQIFLRGLYETFPTRKGSEEDGHEAVISDNLRRKTLLVLSVNKNAVQI